MALKMLGNIRATGIRCLSTQSVPLNSNSLESITPRFHKKLLDKNSNFSNECWATWRKKISNNVEPKTISIDYAILDICDRHNRVDAAQDFVNFMHKHKLPLSPTIISKYLYTYRKRGNLTETEEKGILALYDILKNEFPLEETVAQRCVHALSLTKRWKEADELMKTLKTTNYGAYLAVILAAFRNSHPELAWKRILEMYPTYFPRNLVCAYHVSYCVNNCKTKTTFMRAIERMFNYWHIYYVIPQWSHIKPYIDNGNKFNWIGKTFENNSKGTDSGIVCPNCSNPLKVNITEEELLQLSDAIYKNYICAKDSKITKPALSKFMQFLEEEGPFDIVMDGLNIFHSANDDRGDWTAEYPSRSKKLSEDKQEYGRTGEIALTEIVKKFVEQKKSVLVLSRQHLLPNLKCISQTASVWSLNNFSNDDAYLLYATMKSGLQAMFVSRDLMRNHQHILKDPTLHNLFRQWQWTHQINFIFKSDDSIDLRVPSSGQPLPQKINNCWHIPYKEKDENSNEFISAGKWVCFRHVDNWPSN